MTSMMHFAAGFMWLFIYSSSCRVTDPLWADCRRDSSLGLELMQMDLQLLRRSKQAEAPVVQHRRSLFSGEAAPSTQRNPPSTTPYRIALKNVGDIIYVAKLKVGGQDLRVIMDTGSFDAVFFSDKCSACGPTSTLYHSGSSTAFEDLGIEYQADYGSGSLINAAAFETVEVGALLDDKQLIWLTVKAEMPIASDDTFAGIFGLGPPPSASLFARELLKREKASLADIGDGIMQANDRARKQHTVETMHAVVELLEKNDQWLTRKHVQSFSFCLQRHAGAEGYVIFWDDSYLQFPSLFTRTSVSGAYWSTQLSAVQLLWNQGDAMGQDVMLKCETEDCIAIIDTGTSLVAAPTEVANIVSEFVYNWTVDHGCDNLSGLPQLHFSLDGKDFHLPPSSYLGKMKGVVPAGMRTKMPHLSKFQSLRRIEATEDTYCASLVMSTGDTMPANVFIFGMPFFRKYYTTFHMRDNMKNPDAMFIAENGAGGTCRIGDKGTFTRTNASADLPLVIDARQLRFSRLMDRTL